MAELMEVVDKDCKTICVKPRDDVISNHLKHKCVLIIVKNSENKFFFHQRTASKRTFPLKWASGAGGGVSAGESFEAAARRELKEELEIDIPPTFLFDFDFCCDAFDYKGKVYVVVYDGDVKLNKRECLQGKWMSVEEINDFIQRGLLCPDTALFMKKYFELHR